MDNEIEHILALIGSARSAWDQYNIQLSLPPADTPRLAQGHPWDAYNNGRRAPQARRDPAAVGAARNRLQGSLVELSDTANRVRGRLALAPVSAAAPRRDDRRVGAFSRVWSTGDPHPASPDSRSETASVAGADTSGAARGRLAGQPALVR
jgi:hypothetical protein